MSDMFKACPFCGVKNRIPPDKYHLQPKCGRCGQKIGVSSEGTVVELSDKDFDQRVLKSALPVMVDFYSPTCGPCHMLAPTIELLAGKYAGKVVVAKLDTNRNQNVASRYQIRGVPTLMFFKNGQVVDQLVGAVPQSEIEQKLSAL